MLTRLSGWISFIGVIVSSLLYLFNTLKPTQEKTRVNSHCTIGKITIPTLAVHILSQPLTGFAGEWIIWSGLGLYLIIIVSGIILLYIPGAGWLRYQSRSIHSALVVGLLLSLLHHVISMIDLF
jgi:biotin transporter BioY